VTSHAQRFKVQHVRWVSLSRRHVPLQSDMHASMPSGVHSTRHRGRTRTPLANWGT
jgi:hypothetical protein